MTSTSAASPPWPATPSRSIVTAVLPRGRHVEPIAWTVSVAVIALHVTLYRFEMVNLDGISYLELGWAWADGRWADAINGYWSPLYPLVLAAALAIFDPSPYWEYPLVHFVNGVVACGALAGFAYLVRGFPWGRPTGQDAATSGSVELAFSYAIFLWSAIVLLVAWMESPDTLLSAFVYLSAGALVRIVLGDRRLGTYLLLGVSLGLGYLTKAAMMPLAVPFFVAVALADRSAAARRHLLLAGLAFLIVAGPWVTALSVAKGRVTFGDSGRINYVWFVNGSEDWPRSWPVHWPHWSGEAANGVPIQPARRLNIEPAVYEFSAPVAGTYPMWYDPSWWYEGITPHVDVIDQLRRLKIAAGELYRLVALNPYNSEFFSPQPALIAITLVAILASRGLTAGPVVRARPLLWLPPLAAIVTYALVYIEPRYLGAFVALLWVLTIDAIRPRRPSPTAPLVRAAGMVMTGTVAAAIVAATWIEAYPAVRRVLRGERDREHVAWVTAERMRAAGLQPGDAVGLAGNAQVATRWTHLLRVRIVAEVPNADAWKLWGDADQTRDTVSAAFREAGARWFVLEQATGEAPRGWTRVDATPFLLRDLN